MTEPREEQRRLYGEPIAELLARITQALGMTQSGVAGVLGLSPAMLSQLRTGQRLKIGNPLAVARLQALLVLAEESPRLSREEIAHRVEEIRDSRGTLTTAPTDVSATPAGAELVRRLLRAVASGQELERAVEAVTPVAPALAEMLRVYGTGSTAEADRHLASLAHLIRD